MGIGQPTKGAGIMTMQLYRGASDNRSHLSDADTKLSGTYHGSLAEPHALDAGEHSWPGHDVRLPYPESAAFNRVGQFLFLVLTGIVLIGGQVFALYASLHISECGPVCWPLVAWFGALGASNVWIFVRLIVRLVVMSRRRARGDGWLHVSRSGFEFHSRTGKLRRYEWREIDTFMLVESRDHEVKNGVFTDVGFRFSAERRRTLADKLRLAPPCDRDGTKPGGLVDGYWERPLDQAVDLMNEWLTRYKAARDLKLR